MTISPSGSWIWLNGHCRSIQNGRNSQEPIWLCWNWVRNRVNRSKHQFCGIFYPLDCGYRAARLDAGIFLGIFSWLGYRLSFDEGLVAQRGLNMARVWLSRRLPMGAWSARGQTVQNLQVARVGYLRIRSSWFLHQWVRMDELDTVEWSKRVFDNFENSDMSQKHFCFLTNEALIPIVGGRDHWLWL